MMILFLVILGLIILTSSSLEVFIIYCTICGFGYYRKYKADRREEEKNQERNQKLKKDEINSKGEKYWMQIKDYLGDEYIPRSLELRCRTKFAKKINELNEHYNLIDDKNLLDFLTSETYISEHNERYITYCKENYAQLYENIDENGHGLTDKQMDAVFSMEDATHCECWSLNWKD